MKAINNVDSDVTGIFPCDILVLSDEALKPPIKNHFHVRAD